LNLNANSINKCEQFLGHPTLEVLQMEKNKLTNLVGLKKMPALRELYLSEN
jgi:hypothetical protein